MRTENLLSPGIALRGIELRRLTAKVISSLEIAENSSGQVPSQAADVAAFLLDAAGKVPGQATAAQVSDGQELSVGGSTYTFTVVDGEITDIAVS